MILIRYADIYKVVNTEDGLVETLSVKDATLPIDLDVNGSITVQPYFNENGKIFKNVSYINYNGETMKVVGNYKKIKEYLNNYREDRVEVKGFRRYDR